MDRHVKWLRRRILASIATQTAETFAVVAVLAFALMQWLTNEGPLTALFGSVVIAQLVAVARVGHAMRSNPLNYVFMRKYVERPFTYRVSRFHGEDEAHAAAQQLPGFAPVATIRDGDAIPEPIFDIYHDPSRLVAASVSRASGSVALVSSLANGRLLITDARLVPPHERIVMSLAKDDQVATVIATHRRALSGRSDVVELASSAHQVILDSLALEYESYVALGPGLSPFLDLQAGGRSPLRLIARVKPDELLTLPSRLGPDLPLPKSRTTTPAPKPAESKPNEPQVGHQPMSGTPQVVAPQIIAPQMAAPQIAAPQIASPQITAPLMTAPHVVAPQMDQPDMHAPEPFTPEITPTVAAEFVSPEPVVAGDSVVGDSIVGDTVGESMPLRPVIVSLPDASPNPDLPEQLMAIRQDEATLPAAPGMLDTVPVPAPERPQIAPSHFVTVEPDADDVLTTGEPITAEVPVVELPTALPAAPLEAIVDEPLDLQAALAALPTLPVIDANPPVVHQVPDPSSAPAPAEVLPSVDVSPSPAGSTPATLAPAATLAEAVVAAPDNPAALTDGMGALAPPVFTEAHFPRVPVSTVPANTASVVPTSSSGSASFVTMPSSLMASAAPREAPESNVPQDLATALGYSAEARPRLSEVLRSNANASAEAKRARRKSR